MTDPADPQKERLQVVLARHGLASRRGVVSLIEEGHVSVNGQIVLVKGFRVNPSTDKISVDGNDLAVESGRVLRYFLLSKPKGVMTTLQDPHADRVIADFFKDIPERVFPVGRLDRDTTGLLLVTNDGDLAFRLTHPKFGVEKKYKALVEGRLSEPEILRLKKGIPLEEGKTAPCKISVLEEFAAFGRMPARTLALVVLHEGKKRQIRRIFEFIGHRVIELERVNFGPLTIGQLRPGQRRELSPAEVSQLRKAVGLPPSPEAEDNG